MGKTKAMLRQEYYLKKRKEGMTHRQIINSIPEPWRPIWERDLKKSPFEAWSGLKPQTAILILLLSVGVPVIIALLML